MNRRTALTTAAALTLTTAGAATALFVTVGGASESPPSDTTTDAGLDFVTIDPTTGREVIVTSTPTSDEWDDERGREDDDREWGDDD